MSFLDEGVQTDFFHQTEHHSAKVWASQPPSRSCRPHTVTILCVTLGLIWISSIFPVDQLGLSRQTLGFLAAVFLFLVFATLQFPDGVLVRPHPAFWRFVKGASVLYLCLICFLLFQDIDSTRGWLKQLDSSLGVPLVEKDYADDCRLFTWDDPESVFSNLKSKMDVFVIAHFGGWLVKALIIRDTRLLWIMSILFEWMEITCRHLLPNFWECWWDHLLLDVFGCNWLGIYTGMKLARWLEMKNYNWRWTRDTSLVSPILSSDPTAKDLPSLELPPTNMTPSFFDRFMPSQWTVYNWPSFISSYEAFLGMMFFVFGVTFLDLNLFFLKAQLWLEPSHWILLLRTLLFAFIAAAGTRDLYEFVTVPSGRRLGVQGWLGVAIILSELMLAGHFWHALPQSDPMPFYVKAVWCMSILVFIAIGMFLFVSQPLKSESVVPSAPSEAHNKEWQTSMPSNRRRRTAHFGTGMD